MNRYVQSDVCVHTPLRISLVPNALAPHFRELEKALYAALRRALVHSREVVLKSLPEAHVTLNPPTFQWSNRALDQLPFDERLHLQACVEKIWGELCVSEGISGWGRNRFSVQGVDVVQALRDPEEGARLDRVSRSDHEQPDRNGREILSVAKAGLPDSRQTAAGTGGSSPEKTAAKGAVTKGDPTSRVSPPPVTVIDFAAEDVQAIADEDVGPSGASVHYDPTELTEADIPAFLASQPSLTEQFYDYSQPGRDFDKDFGVRTRQVLGSIPSTGYLGALFLFKGTLFIRVLNLATRRFVASTPVSGQFLTANGVQTGISFDAHARYEISWYRDADTPELWKRVAFDYLKEDFRAILRDLQHKPHTDKDIRAVTDLIVDNLTRPGVVGFSLLHVNGSKGTLLPQTSEWPKETFRVIPLTVLAPAPQKEASGTKPKDKTGMRPCCSEPVKIPTVTIDGQEHDWGPFECEAPLYQLGSNGDYMRDLVKAIAGKLSIPECEYPARFCIEATNVIGFRQYMAAAQAENDQGEMKAVPGGTGNLGSVDFKPVATASIQTLRQLAGIIPDTARLDSLVQMTYGIGEYSNLLGSWYTGQGASWRLRFIPALRDAMNEAIGGMFISGCFSVVMQLLRVSHKGIMDRIGNQQYAEQFETLIRNEIIPLEYLKRLRDQLSPWVPKSAGAAVTEAALQTWHQARDSVRQLFEVRNPFGDLTRGLPGDIKQDGNTFRIVDSKGTTWSIQDLDAEIALRTSISEGIDPLVTQVTADSAILDRFARNPTDIRGELATLLKEMIHANEDKVREIKEDPFAAFGASKVYEADARFHGTAGSGYDLTGVHKQVHDLIGDSFRNEPFYRDAVKALFDSEEGKKALLGFFEFAGIVLLCVACAPLGVAAGIGAAAYHEHEALEEQKLFRGLINPELVISRAELETDLFCAELGLALSIIPEGGKIAEGVLSGGKTLLKQELKTALKTLGGSAAKAVAKELIEKLEQGILAQFVTEFVKAQVINVFIGHLVIGSVAERIRADFEKTLQAKAVIEKK